jgi:autophagy-related protein 2
VLPTQKLADLLKLPPNVDLTRASIILLRITVPVDIYSTPIIVEVEGVEAHLRVGSELQHEKSSPRSASNHDRHKRQDGGKSGGDQAGESQNAVQLPTARDLAQSFYETEPLQERAELEAALTSKSQVLDKSVAYSEDGYDDNEVGTGTGLALPAFMANFLKGIVDRLKVRIRNVTAEVDVEVPSENARRFTTTPGTDTITVRLDIEDVDIESVGLGVQAMAEAKQDSSRLIVPDKDGKCRISLLNIRGALISESSTLASMLRSTVLSSPSAGHSTLSETQNSQVQTSYSPIAAKSADEIAASVIMAPQTDASILREPTVGDLDDFRPQLSPGVAKSQQSLLASVSASESSRFDDAPEDDDDIHTGSSSSRPMRTLDDSLLVSSFRQGDTVHEGSPQQGEADTDEQEPPFDFFDRGLRISHTSLKGSPAGTPRASVYSKPELSAATIPPDSSTLPEQIRRNEGQQADLADTASATSDIELNSNLIDSEGTLKLPESTDIYGALGDSEVDDSNDSTPLGEDALAQSMLFSHEDAESMYMSAVSHGSQSETLPGAWEDGSNGVVSSYPPVVSPVVRPILRYSDNLEHALRRSIPEPAAQLTDAVEKPPVLQNVTSSSSETQRDDKDHGSEPSSPGQSKALSSPQTPDSRRTRGSQGFELYGKVAKQLFNLDQLDVYIPSDETPPDLQDDSPESSSDAYETSTVSYSMSPEVPGAFSTHIRKRSATSAKPTTPKPRSSDTTSRTTSAVEIIMGVLRVQFDVAVGKTLAKLLSAVTAFMPAETEVPKTSAHDQPTPFTIRLIAERMSLKFLERLTATTAASEVSSLSNMWTKPPAADVLLRMSLKGLDVHVDSAKGVTTTSILLDKFIFGYAKESILSFDASLRMRTSTRDLRSEAGKDLKVTIVKSSTSTRVDVLTLPLHVSIDLQRLDETFSWFGGLSSVLNMGSSMASNTTMLAPSPTKSHSKSRGVHFEAPRKEEAERLSGFRAFVRVGGFVLDLLGKDCSFGLETTAVKIVKDEECLAVAIDKTKLSGPYIRHSDKDPAIRAELNVTRIEFLDTPRDDDLDRLLSLITPSRNKYTGDDDIMVDTLLRQRNKGSVLKITVNGLGTNLTNLEDLKYLPALGEEISKLGTVAKYLPEDDRPGLLTLLRIHDVDTAVTFKNVGLLQLRMTDTDLAHITFPSLAALSISGITVRLNDKQEIIGTATDPALREPKNRFPSVMARLIGDEMEPVVRVKFWNLRVEYSVLLLVALLGLSQTASSDDIAASLVASVATITDQARTSPALHPLRDASRANVPPSPDSRAMIVDVGLQECILALNPTGLSSKILIVLTDSHMSATLPKDDNSSASAELKKGSLLVIDDIANVIESGSNRARRQSFDGGSSQVADLCSMGYVSVSYISSAKLVATMTGIKDSDEKFIDVEVRDDLLVLESCADSTQTLVSALNGLMPPKPPPPKDAKYRTKVVPVEDLLASLSGDAFGTAEGNYDFDEDFGVDLQERVGNIEDEPSELEYDSQHYQPEHDEANEDLIDYDESMRGSVLFDQLDTVETGDGVMLESFQSTQTAPAPVELSFHENHFGTGSALEGTAHRWNSAKNAYDRSSEDRVRRGPLKVCVRDVHVIWNLFDGYDWQHTRDVISKAVRDVESKAIERRARGDRRSTFDQDIEDEETVIGDFLFNSIYIGVPTNRDPRELALAINQGLNDDATETESLATTSNSASPSRQGQPPRSKGKRLRLNRSKHHKITFELKGVNVDMVVFSAGSGETESSIDIRIHDFDIFDHVPTSTWKKFATYMRDAGEREAGSSQIHLEILNVRPIPELTASEIVLKATVLPLRLHVDQDALDFITRFFEFKDDSAPSQASPGEAPFIQRAEVNAIPVKLDFKPKRVDYAGLRSGHTTEFMNFLILDEADMVLRHTIIYGVSGFDKLGKCLNDIWMPDVKRNQLPGVLAGLAPVRSLANVGVGVRDLVVIPMREYRKDGRVVRSISKGAISFARTTGTELVKLGAKLAVGTQTVLQGAEEYLSGPSARDSAATAWDDDDLDEEEKKQISLYADQPLGVVQGLRGGYASLERDLLMARDAIIAVQGEVLERGSAQGAAKAVLRRAPTVILRPVIGASKAIGQTLMGATNSLDPQNRRRIDDVSDVHPSLRG